MGRRCAAFVGAVLALTLVSTAGAQQWDLWEDTAGTAGFDGINPDVNWTFMYGDDLVPNNHVMYGESAGNCAHPSRFCWVMDGGDPSVAINTSNVTINVSFGTNWPMPGASVSLHPGNPTEPAPRHSLVRWTSPVDGQVIVLFKVEDLDTDCGASGDGVDWWLMHDDQILLDGAIVDGGSTGDSASGVVTVGVGDRIDLVVGPGPTDNYICDSTLVRMTVTDASAVFIDGFEWGDTTAWSTTVP